MRINFTHHTRIQRLAALALLALCFIQLPVRAQQPEASASGQNDGEIVLLFSSLPIGIARGQTLRASIGLEQEREAAIEVRALARLFDAQGNLIAQSAEVEIPTRGFRTIDFNGDALPQSGAVGQHEVYGAVIKINVVQNGAGSGQGQGKIILQDPRFLHLSLELFDNLTGETQVHINPPPVSGQTYQDVPPTDTFYVGVVSGQALRVNLVVPNEAELPGQSRRAVLT